MANSFLSAEGLGLIAREASYEWKNNLTFLGAATRTYDGMFDDNTVYQPGNVVQIRSPNNFLTQTGNTVTASDVQEASVPLTLNDLESVMIKYTAVDFKTKVGQDNWKARMLRPAIRSLMNDLNRKIAIAAATQVSMYTGDATANINAYSVIDNAGVQLDEHANNRSLRRYCSLSPKQAGALRQATTLQNSFVTPLNKEITLNSRMGNLAGFDMLTDQSIYHQVSGGVHAGVTVNGAVASGATAIPMTGLTPSTGQVLAGDVFEIAGIYSVNPVTLASTGDPMQFVATATATADAGGLVTVSVKPTIISDVTNSRRNISAAIAGGEALTFKASHHVNLAWSQDALCVVCPKQMALDTTSSVVTQDPVTGYSLKISKDASILDDANYLRVSVLAGFLWQEGRVTRILSL